MLTVMNEQLLLVQKYLQERRASGECPKTGQPFITIAREAGTGAHLLARLLTVQFMQEADRDLFRGWHVFDREICEVVANDPTLHASLEDLLSEHHPSQIQGFVEDILTGSSHQYRLDKKTFEIVRMLATIGKSIIVGRAGNFVTQGMPKGLRIRLVAPLRDRIRRTMSSFNVGRERAQEMIDEQDREGARLVRQYFSADVADAAHYDVVWNTATNDPEDIAAAVVDLVRRRAARPPAPRHG